MKSLFLIILFILYIISPSFSKTGQTNNWDQIVNSAQNKTVKLHAWGGSKNINNYERFIYINRSNNIHIFIYAYSLCDNNPPGSIRNRKSIQ